MKNPFPDPVVFESTEPIDLPALNDGTTEDLIMRIDAISAQSLAGEIPRSQCVLVLGPAGSGKTHLFQRLRKKRGGRSVFFYTRPEPGAIATPRYLLAQIVDALRLTVPRSERTQLDLIAAAMLSRTAGHPRGYPLAFLSQTHDNPNGLVEQALQAAERQYPKLAPKYLERLLLAPFQTDARTRRATYAWLSGRPPSEDELALLREPQGLSDEDILPALRTLGFAAAFGAPLVIVIDQIENLADDDPARARLTAHTQLISEIYDTVPGMLVVQMAIDSEWTRFIEPSLAPQMAIRVRGTVLTIHPPTPEQSRQIVNLHLDQIPPEERLREAPWPFDEATLARWSDETMTPRALLQRCKSAFDDFLAGKSTPGSLPPPPTPGTLDRRLQVLWDGFVDAAREEIDRAARDHRALDAERIASGLLAVLPLRGAAAKRVSGKKNRPDVRVATSPTSLVLVAQHNHHRSLAALLSEAQFPDAGRVVAVREGSFAIPSTWKQVHALLGDLQARPHFSYAKIGRQELTEWLACEGMLSAGRSKDLNDDAGRVIDNPVVVAWLERKSAAWCSEVLDRIAGPRAVPSKPEPLDQGPSEPPEKPATGDSVPAPETARAGGRSPEHVSVPAPPIPHRARIHDKAPAPPERVDLPPNTAPDPGISTSREVEELETRILEQLVKLGVRVAVIRRIVGARLIRLELSVPRQRVADLDKAAPDVEHKLANDAVCFEREGPRRFFSARRTQPRTVRLDDLVRREEAWLRDKPGRFLLGESLDGQIVKGDLADGSTCHLLVAGQSGSGKSVLLSGLVLCLAAQHPPARVRFTLGDPKRVTFTSIADQLAGHVEGEVAYTPDSIVDRLENLAAEMDARYRLFQQGHVRDIHGHNACAVQKLPLHVVVIDEFADMIADKAFKQSFLDVVKRIGNMGRAAGIHMILATQRPDKNAVPGEIKANLSGKVALRVQSAINSRIVLDAGGAEKLLGKGDFLADLGHGVVRGQAPELSCQG